MAFKLLWHLNYLFNVDFLVAQCAFLVLPPKVTNITFPVLIQTIFVLIKGHGFVWEIYSMVGSQSAPIEAHHRARVRLS